MRKYIALLIALVAIFAATSTNVEAKPIKDKKLKAVALTPGLNASTTSVSLPDDTKFKKVLQRIEVRHNDATNTTTVYLLFNPKKVEPTEVQNYFVAAGYSALIIDATDVPQIKEGKRK